MSNKIGDVRALRIMFGNVLVRSARMIFQIFINIFIWKETQDIKVIALFNLIFLTSHTFFFTIFSGIAKKGYRRLLNIFSMIGFILVYISIMILGNRSIEYLFLIPFFTGMFNGIYRINFHNIQFELTNYHNRGNFEGIKKMLFILSRIIVPSFIGFIITLNYLGYGYQTAFGIGMILFLLSLFIGTVKVDVSNNNKYDLFGVLNKAVKNKDVFRSLYTYSLTGFSFSNSLLDVIIPIIIFSYVKEEMNLGFLISGFAVVSIIGSYIFGKFVPYSKYRLTIFISGLAYVLSIFGFLSFSDIKYIVLFTSILSIFSLIYSIPQKVISDNIIHKMDNYKLIRSEYMVVRELFLYVGWTTSFIILYFLGSIEIEYLYYLFVVIMFAVGIATYSLSKVEMVQNKK